MNIKAEAIFKQLNKHGEELCGDTVKIRNVNDSTIVVLSDGLGSGVKAHILSTLTCEILSTMFKERIDLKEIVRTLVKTLPVCKVRGIAYSTFTICVVKNNGEVRIINYDGPLPVIVQRGKLLNPESLGSYKTVEDKRILDIKLFSIPGDSIFLMSDGILHAGLGNMMNFGWGWENVSKYLQKIVNKTNSTKKAVETVIELTNNYYGNQPGDDATLVGIRIKEKKKAVILTGPPLDPTLDEYIVKRFLGMEGYIKIICGGTTGNIVSRYLGKEIKVDLSTMHKDVPPIGKLEGIDLVTEGILTLKKVIEIFKMYGVDPENIPNSNDGASKMARLIAESDEIKLMVGQRINPFYQNPSLPFDMSVRHTLVTELTEILSKEGKIVTKEHF
ncbi:PP2C family protein-serine/threonine phosphatase [Kosmotoga pacifica]|uniref:PPM-type phosphatase domain-containing protein n=1 Tax=Kosmotoga pacifica TaxID=1330330 RepID=A0A0G2Z5A4_9BACT|nr:PP2C family protein-serine/threonine phosphatase [Kosmotoga pacifica]AKI96747.1 hypothetical protein IX53_01700 [Kosmotoga pacifica]